MARIPDSAHTSPTIQFGDYTLLERLGAGGMAEVWKASLSTVDGFEKMLVIKRMLPEHLQRTRLRDMFVQEARLVSSLQHPNIVQVFQLGEVEGEHFIAMEWVDGWDLLQLLVQAARAQQHVPVEVAVYIAARICEALAHAHEACDEAGNPLGIVHHDVSPSNVLIARYGGVKLGDFGLARLERDADARVAPGKIRGKLSYVPPELVATGRTDSRGDIFSVGVCLYEMLTRKRLFRATTPEKTLENVCRLDIASRIAKHRDRIPGPLVPVLKRMLMRDPDVRYQSASDLRDDLEDLLFELGRRVGDRDVAAFAGRIFDDPSVGRPRIKTSRTTTSASWGSSIHTETSSARGDKFVVKKQHRSEAPFGPVGENTMDRMIRSGAVAPEDMVSRNGADYQPAGRTSGLGDAMASAWSRPGRMEASGDWTWRCATRVLVDYTLERATGRLELERPGVRKTVWLKQGFVVGIQSNIDEEMLGSVLVAAGKISAVQLQTAVAASSSADIALGQSLLRMGLISGGDLAELLDTQLRLRLRESLVWERGTFQWHPSEEGPPGGAFTKVDALGVIPDALRGNVRYLQLVDFFRDNGNPRLSRVSRPPFELDRLRLKGAEHRLVRRLHVLSMTSSQVMAGHEGADDRERARVAFILFLLFQTGLVTPMV